eukprot:CFRG3289T1
MTVRCNAVLLSQSGVTDSQTTAMSSIPWFQLLMDFCGSDDRILNDQLYKIIYCIRHCLVENVSPPVQQLTALISHVRTSKEE